MQRRKFLLGAGATTATLVLSGQIWQSLQEKPHAATPPENTTLIENLDVLCDLVIPSTDTPGAKAVGVSLWITVAAERKLMGISTAQVKQFIELLNAPTPFLQLSSKEQLAHLQVIDDNAFNNRSEEQLAQLWRQLKALILMGYYSSEVGASQELRYNLVPGKFIPDLEIDDGESRAWSSDWTAVMFG